MRAIGLDISDSAVEAVLAKQWFGPVTLLGYSRADTPSGATFHGVVREPMLLAPIVQDILVQLQTDKTDYLYTTMPESVVFSHAFTFPRQLSKDQIIQGVKVQFDEYFPYDFSDAVYSWQVIDQSDATQSVLVVSTRRQYVEAVQVLADAVGIRLGGIDVESMASARAVLPQPIPNGEAVVLIDIGARVTSISIFDHHGIHVSQVLHNGGERLAHALKKNHGYSDDDTRRLLFQRAATGSAVAPIAEREQLLQVISEQFMPLIATSRNAIMYYETISTATISGVYLSGGASLAPGVDTFIADQLALPVHHGEPLKHVHDGGVLVADVPPISYANAIGLVIGALDKKRLPKPFNFLVADDI